MRVSMILKNIVLLATAESSEPTLAEHASANSLGIGVDI